MYSLDQLKNLDDCGRCEDDSVSVKVQPVSLSDLVKDEQAVLVSSSEGSGVSGSGDGGSKFSPSDFESLL